MNPVDSLPTPAHPRFNRASFTLLADTFRAFADPTRLALLRELLEGPKTVNELFNAVGTTQANISRQLKLLHKAGLLNRKQSGLFVSYSISDPLVLEICNMACRKIKQTTPEYIPDYFI